MSSVVAYSRCTVEFEGYEPIRSRDACMLPDILTRMDVLLDSQSGGFGRMGSSSIPSFHQASVSASIAGHHVGSFSRVRFVCGRCSVPERSGGNRGFGDDLVIAVGSDA
jgi:hypothetical protein